MSLSRNPLSDMSKSGLEWRVQFRVPSRCLLGVLTQVTLLMLEWPCQKQKVWVILYDANLSATRFTLPEITSLNWKLKLHKDIQYVTYSKSDLSKSITGFYSIADRLTDILDFESMIQYHWYWSNFENYWQNHVRVRLTECVGLNEHETKLTKEQNSCKRSLYVHSYSTSLITEVANNDFEDIFQASNPDFS